MVKIDHRTLYIPKILLIILVYYSAGRLGLLLDAVSGLAAAVWPPTGISLFTLFSFGLNLWPGVFLGAFILNLSIGAPFFGALGMASGNTLEAVIGAYTLRHVIQFDPAIARLRDVLGLVLFAGLFSTLLSATIGVLSGYVSGVIAQEQVSLAWRAWWTGDIISNLVLAPVLFTLGAQRSFFGESKDRWEALAFLSAVVVVAYLSFFDFDIGDRQVRLRPYLMFPLLIWSALSFTTKETAMVTLFIAAMATLSKLTGHEPFTRPTISEGLIAAQVFIGVLSVTGMFLAAALAERRNSLLALVKSERALTAMVEEKEVLLKEIHHRVKNNLQIITSLINLQASSTKDEKVHEFYNVTQRRVRSMALIHEQLYKSADLSAIDMGEYVEVLARELTSAFESTPGRIMLEVNADTILLSLDKAIPCGLLLQELVSNAFKHAFPEDRKGKIRVSLVKENSGLLALSVADNGVGLPEGFDVERSRSLGLRIVNTLATQLRAKIEFTNSAGTEAKIRFSDERKPLNPKSTQVAHLSA